MYISEAVEAIIKKMYSLPIASEDNISEFVDYLLYKRDKEDRDPAAMWHNEFTKEAVLEAIKAANEGKLDEHETIYPTKETIKALWTASSWDWYIKRQRDKDLLGHIYKLLKYVKENSYGGLGCVEMLEGDFSGWYSRRIDGMHRLIYRVQGYDQNKIIQIAACC